MTELPKYRCHKEAWAPKIADVTQERCPDGKIHLVFEDPKYAPREVVREWYEKHQPRPGGYFVVYEDGYESYSPAAAFEAGYTRI